MFAVFHFLTIQVHVENSTNENTKHLEDMIKIIVHNALKNLTTSSIRFLQPEIYLPSPVYRVNCPKIMLPSAETLKVLRNAGEPAQIPHCGMFVARRKQPNRRINGYVVIMSIEQDSC